MPHRTRQGSRRLRAKDSSTPAVGPGRSTTSSSEIVRRVLVRVLAAVLPVLTGMIMTGGVATASAQPGSGPPVNTSAPAIKGKATDGKKLKVTPGSWSGLKPFAYAYSWQRCDAAGEECAPIPGAKAAAYQATSADVGHRLRAVVMATNTEGGASVITSASAKITPVAPKKKKPPTVAGTTQDGQVLTAANGTWRGTQPIAFTYQWQSCNGSACASIPGATQSSYRAASAQLGEKLRVMVTGTNSAGSTSATSTKSATIAAGPPVGTGAPSVSGLPVVEQALTAENGTWAGTGPFAYTYQWRSCNLLGECEDISGATGQTYTVGPLQIANSIEVVVTATNSLGSTSATSEPTSLIGALLPSNTGLPSITGLLQDGGLLSAVTGSWSGTEPLSYGYQWLLCNSSGASCKEVSGATGSTLGLITSMIGSTVRLVVTATNGAGSTSATSEPTSAVKALLPSNTVLPGITGLLQTGQLLTALKGTWTGSEPIDYTYQWQTCGLLGLENECRNIKEAIKSTLKLELAQVGLTLRVIVTATNAAGAVSTPSSMTGLVTGLLLSPNSGATAL